MKMPLFLFILLLVSCGPKESTRVNKRGVYINNVNRSPVELVKQYPTCSESELESDNPFFSLIQFLQGRLLTRNIDMQASISGTTLSSMNGIRETYYDAKMMLKKTFKQGGLVGLEFVTTQEPKVLNICPGVKKYERYSYENAALSANYSINKTIQKLEQVNFKSQYPLGLYISPYTIERQVIETNTEIISEDSRITDNAFYIPSLRSIVFLPQSKESREGAGFGNVPLWEVPMVGSHEYGHHVFYSIAGQFAGDLHRPSSGCFGEHKSLRGQTLTQGLSVGDVIGALNEGFSDLIAYYTLDGAERGLNNVVCMEKNREVGSPVFADNTSKLFTSEVINVMFGDGSPIIGSCLRPNFKHIHIVGAVFASITERLMQRYSMSNSEKLALILNWLVELRKTHNSIYEHGGERYLVKAYSLMAGLVKKRSSGMPESFTCQLIESLAPESEYMIEELESLGCR